MSPGLLVRLHFGTWLLLHDRWPPCHRSM